MFSRRHYLLGFGSSSENLEQEDGEDGSGHGNETTLDADDRCCTSECQRLGDSSGGVSRCRHARRGRGHGRAMLTARALVSGGRSGLLRDHSVDGDLVGGSDGAVCTSVDSRAVNAIAGLSDGLLLGSGRSGGNNDVLGVGGRRANADLLLDVDNGLAGVIAGHDRRRTAGALSDLGCVVLGDSGWVSRDDLSSADCVSLSSLALVDGAGNDILLSNRAVDGSHNGVGGRVRAQVDGRGNRDNCGDDGGVVAVLQGAVGDSRCARGDGDDSSSVNSSSGVRTAVDCASGHACKSTRRANRLDSGTGYNASLNNRAAFSLNGLSLSDGDRDSDNGNTVGFKTKSGINTLGDDEVEGAKVGA